MASLTASPTSENNNWGLGVRNGPKLSPLAVPARADCVKILIAQRNDQQLARSMDEDRR